MGAVRSIALPCTNEYVALVPRMNITAMIGVATTTEREMLRPGSRDSPAMMATHSNPLSAPMPNLPSTLALKSDILGTPVASGWYVTWTPRATATTGAMISAANATTCARPPKLCTHLPTRSPNTDTTTIMAMSATPTASWKRSVPASAAARGPMAYESVLDTARQVAASSTSVYTHRFQAVRNPQNSPNPTFVH